MNTNKRFERSTSSLTCPKCGSEEVSETMLNEDELQCCHSNCLHIFSRYQQRLDKVLSKFECIYRLEDYQYQINASFGIRYYVGEFRIFSYCECNNFNWSEPISLDTVEHLIKDLEGGIK
jgi:transcription elongation factor Elf1